LVYGQDDPSSQTAYAQRSFIQTTQRRSPFEAFDRNCSRSDI
jgi:hypothetical protein